MRHLQPQKRLQHHCISDSAPRKRSGVLMAWAAPCLLVAGLCTAFVINHIWISGIHADAQRCAEAAALAAGQGVLSDDMLRSNSHQFELDGRLERGRSNAVELSGRYSRSTPLPRLSASDIHYSFSGHKQQATQGSSAPVCPDEVTVCFRATEARNQLGMFFSGITGLNTFGPSSSASVRIEHTPAGFQPTSSASVPMLPLAIPDSPGSSSGCTWTSMIEQNHGPDGLAWIPERQQIETGPDGLPEITLTICPDESAPHFGKLQPWCFPGERSGDYSATERITHGLTLATFQSAGVSCMTFPQKYCGVRISRQSLPEVAEAIGKLRGRAVLFCLVGGPQTASAGSSADEQVAAPDSSPAESGASAAELTRPVAARIMNIRLNDEECSVTLQPCVLCTSTAVTGDSTANSENRYVYRLSLRR
jgi:hypothetical protein